MSLKEIENLLASVADALEATSDTQDSNNRALLLLRYLHNDGYTLTPNSLLEDAKQAMTRQEHQLEKLHQILEKVRGDVKD